MQPTCSGDKTVSCNSTSFQFSTKALTEPGRGLRASPDICGSSSELPIFFVATSSGSFPLSNIVPSESSVLTSWSEQSPVRWGRKLIDDQSDPEKLGKEFCCFIFAKNWSYSLPTLGNTVDLLFKFKAAPQRQKIYKVQQVGFTFSTKSDGSWIDKATANEISFSLSKVN